MYPLVTQNTAYPPHRHLFTMAFYMCGVYNTQYPYPLTRYNEQVNYYWTRDV